MWIAMLLKKGLTFTEEQLSWLVSSCWLLWSVMLQTSSLSLWFFDPPTSSHAPSLTEPTVPISAVLGCFFFSFFFYTCLFLHFFCFFLSVLCDPCRHVPPLLCHPPLSLLFPLLPSGDAAKRKAWKLSRVSSLRSIYTNSLQNSEGNTTAVTAVRRLWQTGGTPPTHIPDPTHCRWWSTPYWRNAV